MSTRFIHVPENTPARIREAIASVSDSWHIGVGVGGAVVVAGGEWASARDSAVSAGASALLVVEAPTGFTAEAPVPVVVDLGWNHDPAIDVARPEFDRLLDRDSLVEATVTGPADSSAPRVLLAQLTMLRALMGRVGDLQLIRSGRGGYDILGTLACGARVALAGIFSGALTPQVVVRLVMPLESVEMRLTSPDVASPGTVQLTDGSSIRAFPTIWETSGRLALRRVEQMIDGRRGVDDTAALLEELEAISRLELDRM